MDRIIGLDLGSKTCGVSICDALHITCRALTTVRFESDDYDACFYGMSDLQRSQLKRSCFRGMFRVRNVKK